MDLVLENVEIPEGTTEITETTFFNHRLVGSVTIPESVLVIGEKAFADCVNLHEIVIPSSVMAISKYAFHNCIQLESVEIPDGITVIEESAFEGCENIESLILPESVTAIKEKAFAGCTGIKNLVIPDNLTSCAANAFPNSQKYLPINKCYKYVDGMMINTTNSMLLFYNGTKSWIKTPEEVKGIAFRAFAGTSIKKIRLSNSVTSISDQAFVENTGIVNVIVPESVDYIESSAFDTHSKLFCKPGSYADGWCRNNVEFCKLDDEEI